MAAANMYVTVAGAGNNSGDSWDNAMALSDWQTDMTSNAEAGDVYFVAAGTYTFTSNTTAANDGTAVAPIKIIGVKSGTTAEPATVSDWATDADRPVINHTGYSMEFDNYWYIQNLIITHDALSGFRADIGSVFYNLKITNTSESSGRVAVTCSTGSRFIGCEIACTNGTAMNLGSYGNVVYGCYVHDSTTGIVFGDTVSVINSVIDTCTTGINLASTDRNIITNCTIYNCTTGISGTDGNSSTFANNIIDACTTGASWSTEQKNNFWDYNIWDNGTDTSNVTKGGYAITSDPSMTNPDNGDFTLGGGSSALNAGLDTSTFTEATT